MLYWIFGGVDITLGQKVASGIVRLMVIGGKGSHPWIYSGPTYIQPLLALVVLAPYGYRGPTPGDLDFLSVAQRIDIPRIFSG